MPPFTREMAKRHKKGLSAKQQRQWVAVARSTYSTCKSKGGSESTCEAQAIRAANGVTGEPALTTERRLVIQAELTVPPHRHTLHNREHLVAPAVLIVEGVLNGAYIPGTALRPDLWDGMPVVIGHPLNAQGIPISARAPEVYDQYGIGHVYRTQGSTGERNGVPVRSLLAELWLDMDRIEAVGGEALQALEMVENEIPLELSTGFYSDALGGPGLFQNVPYVETLLDIRPDHLALLPNSLGACSWADGCGMPRLHTADALCTCRGETCRCHHQTEERPAPPGHGWRSFLHMLRAFVAQESPAPPPTEADEDEEHEDAPAEEDRLVTAQTDRDVREALGGCLAREMGVQATPFYIADVDHAGQSFTYQMGERLCRRYWTQGADGVITLTDTTEDVQRQTNYVPVPGTSGPGEQETYTMTTQGTVPSAAIKARVNALIHHERTGWNEGDRHHLETMSEAALIRLGQETIEREQPVVHEATSLEEAVARHIPEDFGMRETIASAVRRYERHKTRLIDIIVNTKSNPFTREELQRWDDTRLEQLVMMAGEVLPDQTPPHVQEAANYTGRRMPQIRIVQDEDAGVPGPPDTLTLVVQKRRELGLMN